MNVKAIWPFVISFLLLTTVVIIDRRNFNDMKEYTARVDRTREVINSFERLSNHFKSAQIYSSSFANIAPKNYYLLYKRESDNVQGELTHLKQLIKDDPEQAKRIDSLARLIALHWSVVIKHSIAEIVGSGEGWRLNDLFAIHSTINQAIAYENNLLHLRKERLTRSTNVTSNLSAIFSVLALGILLAAFASNLGLNHRRRRLESLLESILNTSRNGIINYTAIRENGRIIDLKFNYANAAVQSLLNAKPDDIIDKRLSVFPYFSQNPALVDRFIDVVETGQQQQFEWLFEENGHRIWLHVILARLDDGLTATLHDITQTKRYQEELQVNIQQLNRSNEHLQQFAYVASHDLQEPLRKIQAFGDILQHQYGAQFSEQAIDILHRMQAASRRMSSLIQDLLAFSRLSAQPASQQVSLQTIVTDVLTDLEMVIQHKQASLHIDPLPSLPGDPLQLRQLFQNLLSNALKFGRPDAPTEIFIRCRQINDNQLPHELPSARGQSFYEIAVADNGIGFDERYTERIFQLFQRLHNRATYSGTGIGLAICKKVVENHYGYITAHSQPNQGATFTVYLPAD